MNGPIPLERVAGDATPLEVLRAVERVLMPSGCVALTAFDPARPDDIHFTIVGLSVDGKRADTDAGVDGDGEDRQRAAGCTVERKVHVLSSYVRNDSVFSLSRDADSFTFGDIIIAGGDCWKVKRAKNGDLGGTNGCEVFVTRFCKEQFERGVRFINAED